jgi:hypothetical protein
MPFGQEPEIVQIRIDGPNPYRRFADIPRGRTSCDLRGCNMISKGTVCIARLSSACSHFGSGGSCTGFIAKSYNVPRAVFTRMYGASEWEAPPRQGKLRWNPYICSGTALAIGIISWELVGDRTSPPLRVWSPLLKRRHPTYGHKIASKWAHHPTQQPGLAGVTVKLITSPECMEAPSHLAM